MEIFIALFALFIPLIVINKNSETPLNKLIEGNRRFASGKPLHPNSTMERVKETSDVQNPFAVILTCADSRIPTEIILDQGIGDIFTVRVAGNIVDEACLASIEFAAAELKVPLVFVLGHDNCGAIIAASGGKDRGKNLNLLAERLMPAITAAESMEGDKIKNAVEKNVWNSINQLTEDSEILKKLYDDGRIKIAGGIYSMETGGMRIIKE